MISDLTTLVAQFQSRTLPKSEWTHEAHLMTGTWYVRTFGAEAALEKLRNDISAYNVSVGGVNSDTDGYHETITAFYVKLIACVLGTLDTILSTQQCAELIVSHYGDRALPLRFYSKEYLFSREARKGWVEPDLEPLDFSR